MPATNNLPFFLSLTNGSLQVMSGSFIKEGFSIDSLALAKLPLDVSQSGVIKNEKMLGEMIIRLKDTARPKKIRSNFCWINLPDELVFSKFLRLPQVKKEEIEQTIYFKIKNFLPHLPENMYLDWQMTANGKQEIEVSVVGVRKEIIDSYFNVFKKINVFPLGFEPESYSLARLAGLIQTEPSVVIFLNGRRGVICFCQAKIVFLATTFNFSSPEKREPELMAELAKLLSFWQMNFGKEKKINDVFIGGQTENELLLKQKIKELFGFEPKKINLPVILPGQTPDDYLAKIVPLTGLAFTMTAAEKDAKKISLIPEKIKEERDFFDFSVKVKKLIKATGAGLMCFISLFSAVFLFIFFQLLKVNASLSGWEKIIVTPNQLKIEKQAVNLNQKLITVEEVWQKKENAADLLLEFVRIIPAGIIITDFDFSVPEKKIEIRGTASQRQDILALEKKLSKFGQVSIPLSSFEDPAGPEFRAVIKIKEN